MSILGIIAEYNPFHNGHAYQIAEAKAMGFDKIVVILSGPFVQRGEPAVCSKRARTQMALLGGADVVLELPVYGALSSAQGFARMAVETLIATGVVTDLCFGSECGDITRLQKVADALQQEGLDEAIKEELGKGVSYPAARQRALERVCEDAVLLSNPNDLLGVEYLMAAKGRLTPHAILRQGAAHDSRDAETAGATACRTMLKNGESIDQFVPDFVLPLMQEPVFLKDMERAMLAQLRRMSAEDFAKIPDVSEGLEHKIVTAVRQCTCLEQVIDTIKSKRYARSRISRILMRAYLGLSQTADAPEYIRILGFRKSAADLLGQMREKATSPIVQHVAADDKGFVGLAQDLQAGDIWGAFAPTAQAAGSDYREFPVMIE